MLSTVTSGLVTIWLVMAAYGPLKTWTSIQLLRRQRKRFLDEARGKPKGRVALIVSAKGRTRALEGFFRLVLDQDYPDYRLIFVTESAEDEAAEAFRSFLGLGEDENRWRAVEGELGAREVLLVSAGLSEAEGQKVHNQRAAFEHLEPEDEIVAFADADIVGDREWLGKLAAPLNLGAGDLSTGYRWLIPESGHPATLLGANINASIAVMAGPSWHCLLWGGSMALTREAFDELDLANLLRGCLNDDLMISRAARKAGKRIIFVRSLLAPSPVDYNWSSMFEFARRQYFQVRVYVLRYWLTALGFTTLWLAGVAICWGRLLMGDWAAALPIAAVAGANGIKTWLRGAYLREQFPPEVLKRLEQARRIEWPATTLQFFLHWLMILSALPIRRISWAGIRYEVKGRNQVQVVARG